MASQGIERTHSDGHAVFTGVGGPDVTVKAALFYLCCYALSQILERQLFWRRWTAYKWSAISL